MPIRVRGLPAVEVGVRVVKTDGQRLDLLHLVWPLLQQHGLLRLWRVVRLGLVVTGMGSVVGLGLVVAPLVVANKGWVVVRFMVRRMVGVMVGNVVRLVVRLMVGNVVRLMVRRVVGVVVGRMVRVRSVRIGCKEVRFVIEVLVVQGGVRRGQDFLVQDKVVKVLARLDVVLETAVAQRVEPGKGKLRKFGLERDRLPSRRRRRERRRLAAGGRSGRWGTWLLWFGLKVKGRELVVSAVRFGSQFVRVKRGVKGEIAGAEGAEAKVIDLRRGAAVGVGGGNPELLTI